MVLKSGTQVPDSPFGLTDSELAEHIGQALKTELGATRRAAKTVMRWTHVSDRTARKWLHGEAIPSGLHLLALATKSPSVMTLVLELTGHSDVILALEMRAIERDLERALESVRAALESSAGPHDLEPT